jgi:hypothetical protein
MLNQAELCQSLSEVICKGSYIMQHHIQSKTLAF